MTETAVTGFATGVFLQNSAGSSQNVNAHFNRIIAATTAIDNANNQTVNLENNWWGWQCRSGQLGCGAVTGTGADFDPWLVLTVTAAPNSIMPGGTSTVTADLTHNSDGLMPSSKLLIALPSMFVPPTPVSFTATEVYSFSDQRNHC